MTPMLSKPANAAIGGMNCTIIALFGVNLAIAEAPPPLVITPNTRCNQQVSLLILITT